MVKRSQKNKIMPKSRNNYWVSPAEDGWKVQKEKSERSSAVLHTQKEAEARATQILNNIHGGGERVTQGRDGKIRSKDTINAPDPCPPRDREH